MQLARFSTSSCTVCCSVCRVPGACRWLHRASPYSLCMQRLGCGQAFNGPMRRAAAYQGSFRAFGCCCRGCWERCGLCRIACISCFIAVAAFSFYVACTPGFPSLFCSIGYWALIILIVYYSVVAVFRYSCLEGRTDYLFFMDVILLELWVPLYTLCWESSFWSPQSLYTGYSVVHWATHTISLSTTLEIHPLFLARRHLSNVLLTGEYCEVQAKRLCVIYGDVPTRVELGARPSKAPDVLVWYTGKKEYTILIY